MSMSDDSDKPFIEKKSRPKISSDAKISDLTLGELRDVFSGDPSPQPSRKVGDLTVSELKKALFDKFEPDTPLPVPGKWFKDLLDGGPIPDKKKVELEKFWDTNLIERSNFTIEGISKELVDLRKEVNRLRRDF